MGTASIILCAGMGSRLKSSKSKVLHEVCGRPVAYWSIKHALLTTDVKPIVVIGHQANHVEEKLRSFFHDRIDFAYQEIPDGTGGAVKAALPKLNKNCTSVLVLYGDTPLLRQDSVAQLVTIRRNSHVPIAMMTSFVPEPFGYGRIIRNRAQQIVDIVEERDATSLEREIKEVNPGVYVFEANLLREHINDLKPNGVQKELYLTDVVRRYVAEGAVHGPVSGLEIGCEDMQGVNDRRQLAFAQRVLNRRLLEHWMSEGVSFIDPDTTYVEEGVEMEQDVTIYPAVHLRGATLIKQGAIVENGAIIADTTVERNAHILPYTWCESAHIGESAQVGPFARLRPGAHLDANVKIGNFVEVKNSHLHNNVKAGHLAYIGDAEVGEHVNIGAGSITCNYDGENKHKTKIGAHAFVGSNTTLIAPLTIGEGSYVGGGSTVDQDVPTQTLAIGRARQVNKPRSS